jgi:hypothetical protein
MTHLFAYRPAVIAMMTLALSACGMFTASAPPPPCPDVSVLGDAATLTKFVEGRGRDLTDVLYEARLVDAAGACDYDVKKETGEGTLAVEMAVSMEMARGPANRDGKALVHYFVAVTGKNQEVLNKQDFAGTVEFTGNRTQLQWTDEPVYLAFPLKKGQTGRDFRIYVGYDLTPEELEFNRKQASGTRR